MGDVDQDYDRSAAKLRRRAILVYTLRGSHMRVHLHKGPCDGLVQWAAHDLTIGDAFAADRLPRLGYGTYRVYDVFTPRTIDGRELLPEACARWGD